MAVRLIKVYRKSLAAFAYRFLQAASSDDLELVIQVADFSGAYGGIWAPIALYGESAGIHRMQMDLLGFAGVLVTLIFMSIYFGILYFIYRHRKSLLYAGIFLMTNSIFFWDSVWRSSFYIA